MDGFLKPEASLWCRKPPWEHLAAPGATLQSIYVTFYCFLLEWGFGTPMDPFAKPKASLWCSKLPWEPTGTPRGHPQSIYAIFFARMGLWDPDGWIPQAETFALV